MRSIRRQLVAIVLLATCVYQSHADTYYIRKGGSDSNPGNTPSKAFASLKHAASVVGPGDIVYIGAGQYTEQARFQKPGKESSPIKIIGDTNGSKTGDAGAVELSNTNSAIIELTNADYYQISNINFQSGRQAILIDSCVGIVVQSCAFDDSTESAIHIQNNGEVLIQESMISGRNRGVRVMNGSATIRDTTFESLGTEALEIQNSGSSIDAQRCVIRKVRRGLYMHNGEAILINCLIYGTTQEGVYTRNQSTLLMAHNTIDQIGKEGARFQGKSTLLNNIFSNIGSHCMRLDGGKVDASHNLVFNRAGDRSNRFNSLEFEFDPQYTDAANGNYTLLTESKARDIGYDVSSLTKEDLALNPRPDGDGWDLGAFEGMSYATYFVRTRGSDANNGLSPASAFRTIQKAVEMCTMPGTKVYVGPGKYAESVAVGSGAGASAISGTEGKPIELIADTTGRFTFDTPGEVIIDGRNSLTSGLSFTSIEHWIISNFTFLNQRTYGIYGTNIGAQITDCTFDVPAGYAIYATASGDITVSDCTFDRDQDSAHMIWITPNNRATPTSVLVTRNDATLKDGDYMSSGFHKGIYSVQGRSYRNRYTYGIIIYGYGSPLLERVEVSNNQISDCYLPLYLAIYSSSQPESVIANNTVTGSFYSIYAYAYNSQSISLINNLIDSSYMGMLSYTIGSGKSNVSAHLENDITLSMTPYRRTFEGQVIQGSPMFTNAAAGDYSLMPGSPAIDAGTARGAPTLDIHSLRRPVDGDGDGLAQVDIGAYEQVSERTRIKVVQWREIGIDSE